MPSLTFLTAPSIFLLLPTFLFLLLWLVRRFRADGSLTPPGPRPLPVIGNLHQLDLKNLHRSLVQLAGEYGSVYTVHLGPERAVVLSGYRTVKEALITQGDDFLGRPHVPIMDVLKEGSGIVWSNGDPWRQMRRFTLSALRDFGMGKRSVEEKITEETEFLMRVLEAQKGCPMDTDIQVNLATANVICSIVFGHRFEYGDERLVTLGRLVLESFQLLGSPMVQLFNAYPFLSFLPGSHREICNKFEALKVCLRGMIGLHQESSTDPRSFIEAFNCRQAQMEGQGGEEESCFSERNLLITVSDLLIAGMGTTATTLRWALLLAVKYPTVQRRVQEEIERVMGRERAPRMEDRKHMPYTDAVIHEVQRFCSIAPLGIPRSTSRDITFRGYSIPKGTYVIPLLASVLHDKTEWERPEEFFPEHFLDSEGRFLKKEAFIPFSAGRRVCPGETLARVELFLFFTRLLQRFDLRVTPGEELELTPLVGAILAPRAHHIRFLPRSERVGGGDRGGEGE